MVTRGLPVHSGRMETLRSIDPMTRSLDLDPLDRMLLSTDGTVTTLLEACAGEAIATRTTREASQRANDPPPAPASRQRQPGPTPSASAYLKLDGSWQASSSSSRRRASSHAFERA